MRRFFSRSVAVALSAILACLVAELVLRVAMPEIGSAQPVNDVLFLEPDRVVGWKHPTNFRYVWNGRNPYCIEFGVSVSTNAFGFRDGDWTIEKPAHTIRIAVIGDSFIEAIQVPAEHTAPRRLETRLAARFPERRFEAMNFGVSNYGIGQYLLVYDAYVRQFRPDYVVIVAAYLNFSRTTQRELSSRLQEFYALHVRPSFELDGQGNLRVVPARDHERYAAGVAALVDTQYGPDRSQPIRRFWSPFYLPDWIAHVLSRTLRPSAKRQRPSTNDFPDVALNYRIIEVLNQRVVSDGAELVFADTFEYLERYGALPGSGTLVARNKAFVESIGAHYLDVSPALRQAPGSAEFTCDMHFNETGNRAIGDALFDWFATQMVSAADERR